MTSREDRELGIMKIFEEQARVSVYTRTQLIEEGCNGCLHLDPAQLQFHQLATVLQALETTQDPKKKNHFVCSCLLTIITDRSNMECSKGCYMWTQPRSYLQHRRESFIHKEKGKY